MQSVAPALTFRGRPVYSDTPEHVALVQRILRVDDVVWRQALGSYYSRLQDSDKQSRLRALQESWSSYSPHTASLPAASKSACPVCSTLSVTPLLSRSTGETYGLCNQCGHGVLLSTPSPSEVYSRPDYYQQRTNSGVGYDGYRQEREYREAKADRLFDWISRKRDSVRSVLEVGSGYGFNRAAAERRGWHTMGVDLNPAAASAADELYGMQTFTGTLSQALTTGAIESGCWDLVLYQFVLEHVADPIAELHYAAQATAPGGQVALLIPSMQAVERVVFGASYRSFRPDHLHLFSWRSLDLCLSQAGLRRVASRSECSVHLLAGFLTSEELHELYESGDGPDLVVLAAREAV